VDILPLNEKEDLNRHFSIKGSTLVYKTTSSYQDIYVLERSDFRGTQGKFRLLQFSSDAIQGIVNMEQPDFPVAPYTRITIDLIENYVSNFKKGFIIGHGIGSVSSYFSDKYLVTAEIDPLVVEISKTYFGHSGKNVIVEDGQELLKTLENHSQDIIFLDAFNSTEMPYHLTTNEFFSLTNEKLTDKGILIVNYIGKIKDDDSLGKLFSTISEVFPNVRLYATDPIAELRQNIFLIASRRILEDYSPREATPFHIYF
jgi:spermidine synthase